MTDPRQTPTATDRRRTSGQTPGQTPGGRKPRLIVAGEFSAGKTRLINGLLGEGVLPSNVTATALPPVWIVAGDGGCLAVDLDGTTREISALDGISVSDTHYCILSHSSPFLDAFDIIDTPGNSDPNIPPESWERMLGYADMAVWCTNATQAWRQSEKSVWNEMPEHLLSRATLLVTHADRITDTRSAERVLRRVRREAAEYFDSFLMVSLLREDDLAGIRTHLQTLARDPGPLSGAPSEIVQQFTRTRKAAAPSGIRPRRVSVGGTARSTERPDASEAERESMSALIGALVKNDPAQASKMPDSDPGGALTVPEVAAPEAGTPESGLPAPDLTKPDLTQPAQPGPEAPAKPRVAELHVLTPVTPAAPVSLVPETAGIAVPDAGRSARALWTLLSRGIDLSDAAQVLDRVEHLISALEKGEFSPKSINYKDSDEHDASDVLHSLARRKP